MFIAIASGKGGTKIPFDNVAIEALARGLPVVEYSDNSVSQQIKTLWESISRLR